MSLKRGDHLIVDSLHCIKFLGMNVVQDLAKQKMAVYVMPDVCVRQFSDGMHLLKVVVSQ